MGVKDEYGEDFAEGEKTEREYAAIMSKRCKVIKTSKEVDTKDHIDFHLFYKDKKTSVDVKGVKKNSKGDENPDDSIHYLEIESVKKVPVNEKGEPLEIKTGWVYGKAEYIIFQTNDTWIQVNRLKLVEFIEEECPDTKIYIVSK